MANEPIPIWPCLTYRDAPKAVDWLAEAFGFTAALVVPGPPEHPVAHAELRSPWGGGVMFGSHADGSADGPAPGSAYVYVVCPEPDAVHDRAVAAGAEITRALEQTDYGSRTFTARDPEGNTWSFGTYAGE